MPTTALPKHWKDLVCVDENKTELFGFLSQQVISIICSPAQCDMTNLPHVVTRKQTHACFFMWQMLFRKVTKR